MMHRSPRISPLVFATLTGLALSGLGFLTAYLQLFGGVLATVSYVFLHIATVVKLFYGIGGALFSASRGAWKNAWMHFFFALFAYSLYQTLAAFLEYFFLQGYEIADAIILAVLNGIVSGWLIEGGVLLLFFLIPVFLFLRQPIEKPERPALFSLSRLTCAALASALVDLVCGLLVQTYSMLSFLSEHFWIANNDEIISFILFYLLEFVLALFAYVTAVFTMARHGGHRLLLKSKA